jgi:hypothetical protein
METITLKKMGRTVKLGRRAVSPAGKAPKLAAYLNRAYLKRLLPESVDYTGKAKHSLSQMYANDQYGDCVPAGEAHLVGVRSANDTSSGFMRAGSSGMISRAATECPAAVRWSMTVCPPVSLSSVRVSLTVTTAQRTDCGPWA